MKVRQKMNKKRLLDILTYRRGHNSKGESAFIKKYMSNFDTLKNDKGEVLAYVYDNHNDTKGHKVMWSSHIDTMHKKDPHKIKQQVFLDTFDTAFVGDESDCLGADNGAGVALMLDMIDADIEGVYVFHRGEEIGLWGSSQIVETHLDFIKSFTHSIAFDRRAETSVITHQSGRQGISESFTAQLCDLLSLGYIADPTGAYTDTYQYFDYVSECTNVSIGYMAEHSKSETLNVSHVEKLSDRLCSIDWTAIDLIHERVAEPEPFYNRSYYGSYYDVPMIDELMSYDTRALTAWVKNAEVSDIVSLIQNLTDEVAYSYESDLLPHLHSRAYT
jgi:hypothetical protein